MRLIARLRAESGSALLTTLIAITVMLALGLALLALTDVQARESGVERTRDHAFNLAESVLTSEAFALGRAWPTTGTAAPSGTGAAGSPGACSATGFGATLGTTAPAGSATARIQPNLSASYGDPEYSAATWTVNVCDDIGEATVWSDSLLTGGSWNYDFNENNRMWVRVRSTVRGKTRTLVGLVDVGSTGALPPDFALINGSMGVDFPSAVGSPTGGLLGDVTNFLFGEDHPLVDGRVGIRCGVHDPDITEDCLGGDLTSLSGGLLGSTFQTNQYSRYPAETAVSPDAIAQFRSQAIATGTYVATTTGATSGSSPPTCTKPTAVGPSTIWFIEQVGTGDQYCSISASTSPVPKMIVVGRGRLVIRGTNSDAGTTLNSVVYGLNLQRAAPDSVSPAREVIRIDQTAKVRGAVFVDGKSGQVGMYPKVDCGFLGLGCLLGSLLGSLGSQLGVGPGQQGPVIEHDEDTVKAVRIFTTSGIVPGTFRDLNAGT